MGFVHIGLDPDGPGIGKSENSHSRRHRGSLFQVPCNNDPILRGIDKGIGYLAPCKAEIGAVRCLLHPGRFQRGGAAGHFLSGNLTGVFILFGLQLGDEVFLREIFETPGIFLRQDQICTGLLEIGLLHIQVCRGPVHSGLRLALLLDEIVIFKPGEKLSPFYMVPLIGDTVQ